MQANTLARTSKVLVMATLCIALHFALANIRLQYPFELEWMEGSRL